VSHPITGLEQPQRAVTGRCFNDKDFRGGLENGILLCELLSSIKPGLVKKINRLPTPIAGLDNLSVFLRGCEELGLKGSQLFDPGDLQDISTRPNAKVADCSRKLKNVLITIYWLGRAANSCTSYNGPTLDLKEFEGLLSQMRKEAEDTESPQRSIRDSGYIDCWDSERSDSLSPPRHGREDSFDSLDSFGSRSRQTPSPDVLVARGIGSDGRGSDSESDAGPHGGRKLPDVRKDDMLARRTSVSEPRVMVPFNQYLPNKSNASGYVPTPLRRKRGDHEGREEGSGGGGGSRKSWSTATSPIGGDIPFRSVSMIDMRCEEDAILPHHSQVRHELMHNQYNMMKEEEDHWQDDLARWKSRRRSVSQDLIKKEEERKMMEKLMTGEGGAISQRRKSIKTYREIVEEKERRENDLREAYRLARTPEEAALVLHRYAQRFTISEAVLERLQLPKLLDRSISEDPTATTNTQDTNGPLKYLRQQSLPAPKFTATVEAQVVGFPQGLSHRPQIRSRKPEPNPSIRAVSPKSVPLLMPKPYNQPKGLQMLVGPRPGKVRHKMPANGKGFISVITSVFYCNIVVSKIVLVLDFYIEMHLCSMYVHTCVFFKPSVSNLCTQVDGLLRVNGDMGNDEVTTPESEGRTSPLRFYPSPATPTASSDGPDIPPCEATPTPPPTHSPSPRVTQVSSPVVAQAKRGDRWSWDPNEERKRQERWQQEQERMLQEKYQHEQEKLKQEWERAQREVEEEERRYHEEVCVSACERECVCVCVRACESEESKSINPSVLHSLSLDHISTGPYFIWHCGHSVCAAQWSVCGNLNWVLPCRSVSGKKLCSSCSHPLGKGAAMIIETLSLYFHIQCFKCGVCKGQLGDTTTGTDVRIRNGLLNCHQCYIRSRCESHKITSPHAHTRIHICILALSLLYICLPRFHMINSYITH
uniref:LIM and calponin homology domains 1 n=1 Tax=Salmo trutta TaxID=8032 RepID=A0A674A4B6_SALTR